MTEPDNQNDAGSDAPESAAAPSSTSSSSKKRPQRSPSTTPKKAPGAVKSGTAKKPPTGASRTPSKAAVEKTPAPVAESVKDNAPAVDVSAEQEEQKKSAAEESSPKEAIASPTPAKKAPSAAKSRAKKKPQPQPSSKKAKTPAGPPAVTLHEVAKIYNAAQGVRALSFDVPAGSFFAIVGPNGAGKTTTLSLLSGLARPDTGVITVAGFDVSTEADKARASTGVLPDRLRTFTRLTGKQLLYYYGALRGLDARAIEERTGHLARAFDLHDALGRVVSDYSVGMTKKIMLAGAMIHSPRVLVLDEPFESVDPRSTEVILEVLRSYVAHGGTVVMSSHGMQLIESVCDHILVIVDGSVVARGTVEEIRDGKSLEQRYVELVGIRGDVEGLSWLHDFSV